MVIAVSSSAVVLVITQSFIDGNQATTLTSRDFRSIYPRFPQIEVNLKLKIEHFGRLIEIHACTAYLMEHIRKKLTLILEFILWNLDFALCALH